MEGYLHALLVIFKIKMDIDMQISLELTWFCVCGCMTKSEIPGSCRKYSIIF